jgi:hypothetical protein
MIDWTKPIETMEGWKAKVVSTDYKTISSTLYLVQMERPSGASILGWYREDGQPWETQTLLRNVKVKREGWIKLRCIEWCVMAETKEAIEATISPNERNEGWKAVYAKWEE